MVENQAIGRVLRLRQKRDVKVIRYIIKGTVEEVKSNDPAIHIVVFSNRRYQSGHALSTDKEIGICQNRMEGRPNGGAEWSERGHLNSFFSL